jgi:fatty acid desaturase
MESLKRPFNSRELWRGLVALVVILGVLEIGYRVGGWWLGPAMLLGVVAALELYRRLHRNRKAQV